MRREKGMVSDSKPIMTVDIPPLRLAQSGGEEWKGWGIRPMTHQLEVMRSDERLVILSAPTGGGKTIAYLTRIVNEEVDGLILLPTNVLIEDQYRSILDFLKRVGKTVITPEDPRGESYPSSTDYAVAKVTGSVLSKLAFMRRRRSKGAVLAEIFKMPSKRRILITNPDTIYLIWKGRYSYAKELFYEILRFPIWVVDEFHLYYGVTLINMLFLLSAVSKWLNQLIVSTATPSNILPKLQALFNPVQVVEAKEAETGWTARHRLELEFYSLPSGPVLMGKKGLDIAVDHIERLYMQAPSSRDRVKTMAIVSSIAFCVALAKRLRQRLGEDSVAEIHSLVHAEDRRAMLERDNDKVVVGTSALEVGVDLDVPTIFFEANTAPSFMQRLGRAVRRQDGRGVALLPPNYLLTLKQNLEKSVEPANGYYRVSYYQLDRLINSSLPSPDTYVDFLESEEAAILYLAFVYSVLGEKLKGSKESSLKDMVENMPNPPINTSDLRRLAQFPPKGRLKRIARAGFRGYLDSLPALIRRFNRVIRVGFFDLRMLQLRGILNPDDPAVRRAEGWGELSYEDKLILDVEDFTETPYPLKAGWCDPPGTPIILHPLDKQNPNFELDIQNPGYKKVFHNLLEGLPAYITAKPPDWRFPAIRSKIRGDEWVVVGLEAYLQEHLERKRE